MTPQSLTSLTLGEVFSFLRDMSYLVGLAVFGWHVRGIVQVLKNFVQRVSAHMDSMELFANTVVNNHLRHIEADMKLLSGRKDDLPQE